MSPAPPQTPDPGSSASVPRRGHFTGAPAPRTRDETRPQPPQGTAMVLAPTTIPA